MKKGTLEIKTNLGEIAEQIQKGLDEVGYKDKRTVRINQMIENNEIFIKENPFFKADVVFGGVGGNYSPNFDAYKGQWKPKGNIVYQRPISCDFAQEDFLIEGKDYIIL